MRGISFPSQQQQQQQQTTTTTSNNNNNNNNSNNNFAHHSGVKTVHPILVRPRIASRRKHVSLALSSRGDHASHKEACF